MKRLSLFLVVFFGVLPFGAHAVNVERVVSPSGVEAWLVQDHANPIISMSFAFEGGSELDPADKQGLANLAASTMDEGAGDLTSQQFQQILADKSIELRFSARLDDFTGRLKTLVKHEDEAFDLLRLALTQPRFDDEPVARLKSQLKAGIRSDTEDPGTLAYQELFEGFFPGHGYAQRKDGTEQSVDAITRADLKAFVAERIARDRLKIGVVGDITPDRLGKLLDRTFTVAEHSQARKASEVQARASGRIKVIEKDIVQSTIVFGHAGLKRDDPDYYTALVMNHILGGGSFTSRLYTQVREKRGLAYSVGTSLYPLDLTGLIIGSAGTENARVGETIDVIRAEWARMAAGELTQQELIDAKTYITGSFPLRFISTDAIAGVLVAMQLNDLGLDYLDRRNAYIAQVGLDDVRRVAAQYLDVDKLDIIIVGKPEGIVSNP